MSVAKASWGQANTITFDDVDVSSAPRGVEAIPDGYANLNWSNFYFQNTAVAFQTFGSNGYTNGAVSSPNVALDGYASPATISTSNNTVFDLISVYLTAGWNSALQVTADGYENGTIVDSRSMTLNDSGPTLETLDFYSVTSVIFITTPVANGGFTGDFAMDNLSVYRPDINWISPASGSWDSPSNWDLSAAPTPMQNVIIAPAGPLTVNGPTAATTIKSMILGGGGGTATLALETTGSLTVSNALIVSAGASLVTCGANLTASLASVDGRFAQTGCSSVTIGGTQSFIPLLNYVLTIADNAGSQGSYALSGTGTLAVINADSNNISEYVGYVGSGRFDQSGGANTLLGSLAVGYGRGSYGLYTLSGTGSLFAQDAGAYQYNDSPVCIGYSGTGVFEQSGGLLNAPIGLVLGVNSGSTGTYTLSGTGSLVVGEGIIGDVNVSECVGFSGSGSFSQCGGLNSALNGLVIGQNASSSGTYTLSGMGTLVCGAETVGNGGTGFFNQTGGVNTTELFVGNDGSTGTYILNGASTLCASPVEFIGFGGTGVFNQSGGVNSVVGELAMAVYSSDQATYVLCGGSLAVDGDLNVAGSEPAEFYNGQGSGGTAVLSVTNSGRLSVSGTMKIWNAGLVNLNVANTRVGNLSIVGNGILDLNGALQINFGCTFNDPTAAILSYLQTGYNGGTWTGTSGLVSTSAAAAPTVLSIGYADGNVDTGTAAASGQVLIMLTLAGDANLDGKVDFTDLGIVGQHLNTTGNDWAHGNFTYDPTGLVSFTDLGIVGQNLNQQLTLGSAESLPAETPGIFSISGTVALPEPAAATLALLAATGLLPRRRRRDCRLPRD